MAKKKKLRGDEGAAGFGSNPFAALAGRTAPDRPSPEELAPERGSDTFDLSEVSKLVVRRTKKGRGGKTVTLIEGIESLGEAARQEWARALRSGLGTSAGVEGEAIVVGGDQRERVAERARALGAKRVVIS